MRWYLTLDVAAIVAFVVIGRSTHDEQGTLAGTFGTAAPFLIALVAAWLLMRAWQEPISWKTGIGIWLITAVAGMLLRRFAFHDGTAASFLIAGTLFLGAFLVGWRGLVQWIRPG